MRDCVGEEGCVARLGGDEFAIIQVGPSHPDAVDALANRLLEAVGAPLELDGQSLTPRMSIGVTVAPRDGTDVEHLLKGADIALYQAKAAGGHQHLTYDPTMELRLRARQRLEADLQRAVLLGEFELFYQPIVSARTRDVTGFEALVRWNHPTRGLVSPAEFIPVAEETGLICEIGAWVLRTACAEARTWPDTVSVAVNLSPVQFNRDDLVQLVDDSLRASGLRADRLELEVTESALLRDDAGTVAALHAFRAMGVKVAMDDFGTGYSSLGYLRSFPFDTIKVDQSFVQRLGVTRDAEAVVRAVVMLGRSLGMAITAEGVETAAQAAKLNLEGCDHLQGYLFSPPVPTRDLARFLPRPETAAAPVALAS